ncbi:MAG: alpha/beta hydrolase family protein [Capsulimonadaceae bacterium]
MHLLQRLVLATLVVIVTACPVVAVPASLGDGQLIAPNVRMWSTTLNRADGRTTVWVYLPDPVPATKVPCVLIAPAGSPLVIGMDLSDDDHDEHIPYVQAGMAVVAYSISGAGNLNATINDPQNVDAARQFLKAHAGFTDEQAALGYALKSFSEIDSTRVYSVGHSSAGTLALLVAELDPRIAACAVYAPACNILTQEPPELIDPLDEQIAGFKAFLKRASPITNTAKLTCPVFVFHAEDDQVVGSADNDAFVDKLQSTNSHVTYVRVPTGGHFQAMAEQGIPKAIAWLKALKNTSTQ